MQTDPVPLAAESPAADPRGIGPKWENLDVEKAYFRAGATIMRLGAVYSEHDYESGIAGLPHAFHDRKSFRGTKP